MFSWQLDDELALLFLQPDSQRAVSPLPAQPRVPLPVAAWVPPSSSPPTAPPSFATPSRSLPGEGLTTAIEYQGRWSASSVTTRSIRISAR